MSLYYGVYTRQSDSIAVRAAVCDSTSFEDAYNSLAWRLLSDSVKERLADETEPDALVTPKQVEMHLDEYHEVSPG